MFMFISKALGILKTKQLKHIQISIVVTAALFMERERGKGKEGGEF